MYRLIALGLGVAAIASATPLELTHPARLTEALGTPIEGQHTVDVRLWGHRCAWSGKGQPIGSVHRPGLHERPRARTSSRSAPHFRSIHLPAQPRGDSLYRMDNPARTAHHRRLAAAGPSLQWQGDPVGES
jgi:hypothetical protein